MAGLRRDLGRLAVALKEMAPDYSPSTDLLKRVMETRAAARSQLEWVNPPPGSRPAWQAGERLPRALAVCGKLKSMATTTPVEIRKGQGVWQPRPRIPRSWKAAAGILRRRRVDPLEYQKQVRKQWEPSSDITST